MRTLLLRHIYSGDVGFTAALLIILIAATDLSGRLRDGRAAPVARVTFLVALALGALAGTPLPLWLLVPLVGSLLLYGCLLLFDLESAFRRWSAVVVIGVIAMTVLAEGPYRFSAPRTLPASSRLIVAGDSLASGGFDEQRRWIEILNERGTIEIVDQSRPSQDVAGAVSDLLQMETSSGSALLILIGGNDMLAGRSSSDFGEGLGRLVRTAIARGHHPIFLMELPVLPGRWGYAAQQRRIAREHDLVLIPRRVLAAVLSDHRNTSDGIHLTQRGHEQMARRLAPWLDLEE